MKILIAADMEGVTGVVHWDHVDSKHKEHDRFRKLMTADVNAAIRGAFQGGATEVVVCDGHGGGRNILVEELDGRARLHSGSPKPMAMVQGLEAGVNAVMFVGYHARAGTQNAILDHTWSGALANLWLNGQIMGEIGLNASVSGHFDVPLIMISGDQTACGEAETLTGPLETAVVKVANGRMAAECLPPETTQELIYLAAQQAVDHLAGGRAPAPLHLDSPVMIALEFARSEIADRVTVLPGAQRVDGRRVEIEAGDALAAYRTFQAAMGLASG